jgi:hypothetical protein
MTAKIMARNVDTTAASCGLFPKGTAINKDQLPRVKPNRRWVMITSPTLVALKIRWCHTMETMIHAGK